MATKEKEQFLDIDLKTLESLRAAYAGPRPGLVFSRFCGTRRLSSVEQLELLFNYIEVCQLTIGAVRTIRASGVISEEHECLLLKLERRSQKLQAKAQKIGVPGVLLDRARILTIKVITDPEYYGF